MKLSICIPTYNSPKWIQQCLESVFQHAPACDFEVLALDDRSTDGTADIVRSKFPNVRLFTNAVNLGFSKTVNIGIREARGEYILLLNNDTRIHAHALDALVEYLDANPKAGIVGPKVLSADGSLQEQCRRQIPTPMGALLYFTGLSKTRYLMTLADERQTTDVDSVSGSCMLIRRGVAEAIGLFDEEFYLYGEDMDYCWRAKKAGWRVVYHPDAVITHFGGQGGTGKRRLRATIEFHRAMWLFYRKHQAPGAGPVQRALVYSGIALKGALAVAVNAMHRSATPGTAKPQ